MPWLFAALMLAHAIVGALIGAWDVAVVASVMAALMAWTGWKTRMVRR